MAPNNKKSTASNPTSAGNHIEQVEQDLESASASGQEQILLKALQDFIVPLIRVTDRKRKSDANQISLGPEAGALITALRDFVSNITIHSQLRPHHTIDVSLAEGETELQGGLDDDEEDDESSSEADSLMDTPSYESDEDGVSDNLGDHDALAKPQPTFHEKLLRSLREHVFNTMPIRLLCFEPQGSNLQISLLERGVVHARLASALQARIHEEDHLPKLDESSGTMETDQEAIERLISKYARYAILSHKWLQTASGEVTYSDWNKGRLDPTSPGYQKLVNFCKSAWRDHGLTFGWMDTICINKESSSELDESIRSMYNWYRRADVCVIYLAETVILSNIYTDPWFTRGWTLQELLAPALIKFYNGDWKKLVKHSTNDKMNTKITEQIKQATTITEDELHDIHNAPISRRMQLAANREVTREEDTAYSLMGIFNVSISTAYGEGARRAFSRLVEEILTSSEKVLDIFNWAGDIDDQSRLHNSLVLPSSPQYYLHRSSNKNLLQLPMWPIEPLTLTNLGLHTTVLLMPGISIKDKLPSSQYDPIGDFKATVSITPTGYYDDIPTTYNLLDKRISGPDGQRKGSDSYRITLAVFSFKGNQDSICILKTCLAVCLRCFEDAGKVTVIGDIIVIPTNSPIVFELSKTALDSDDDSDNESKSLVDSDSSDEDEDDVESSIGSYNNWDKEIYYEVKRSDLAKHGMQIVSLYL